MRMFREIMFNFAVSGFPDEDCLIRLFEHFLKSTITMKHICLSAVLLVAALSAAARPVLVGHRGSGYGVESTEEAFRQGAALGYEYVESDIKVTGDRQFVLSHDDDTKRLGGSLTIATSTLAQLQAEELTQTRSGVTYTGRIMSLPEWLTLCEELNIKPLIELKWATGVNNNDCSNIPLLIQTIEEHGFRDKCIILTSMKKCLEYIRTNYPDVELQFLTGQYWANHFDWNVEKGIDVDIQAGYFDGAAVQRYHDAGLKVNMWTTNDVAGYRKYAGWGCDFITTDRLDAATLPDVIPDDPVTPPGEVDLVFERLWVRSTKNGDAPEHIDGTNAQQGTAVNGLFYVNDCADRLLYVFSQGECIGSLPGGSGWGCCRDFAGNIIVRDDKQTGNTHKFMIYPAGVTPDSPAEATVLEIEMPVAGQTNFINASGDVLGDGGYIYLYPRDKTAVNIVHMANGAVTEVSESAELAIPGSAAGYVIPTANKDTEWYYQVRNKGIYYYRGDRSDDFSTGGTSTTPPARNSTGGAAFININNNLIFIHNSGPNYKGGFTVRNQSRDEVLENVGPIGTLGYEEGGNYSTFNWLIAEETAPEDYIIYQYCPANGMAAYRLYNRLTGVKAPGQALRPVLRRSGSILTVSGVEPAERTEVYSLTGACVAVGTAARTVVSALGRGLYIIRCAGHAFKISL